MSSIHCMSDPILGAIIPRCERHRELEKHHQCDTQGDDQRTRCKICRLDVEVLQAILLGFRV